MVEARERILTTSYELFARRGVRAVGVDEVIKRSKVAKATFYRHFRSKTDLVLAFLARREQVWTIGLVQAESERRGDTPEERLVAIFDVFDDWMRSDAFDGCSFISVLLSMGSEHPLGSASIQYLDNLRTIVKTRAEDAGLHDADTFARSWHILMKGSIVAAVEGDVDAALRAKDMARTLIQQHRRGHSCESGEPTTDRSSQARRAGRESRSSRSLFQPTEVASPSPISDPPGPYVGR